MGAGRTAGTPAYGPFRRLYLTAEEVRERFVDHVAVPVSAPLTTDDIDKLAALQRPALLLALAGTETPRDVSTVGLIRATLAAATLLKDAVVVAVPLASRGDVERDHRFGVDVVMAYSAHDPVGLSGDGSLPEIVAEVVGFDRPRWPSVAWCCSSPGCPEAASRPWPAPCMMSCSSRDCGP